MSQQENLPPMAFTLLSSLHNIKIVSKSREHLEEGIISGYLDDAIQNIEWAIELDNKVRGNNA